MKSMKLDLVKTVYKTAEEYNEYIYGSADVVGLMCLKVFVNGNEAKVQELKESAMRLRFGFSKSKFLERFKS
jgi:15-cis-phytoene synthase